MADHEPTPEEQDAQGTPEPNDASSPEAAGEPTAEPAAHRAADASGGVPVDGSAPPIDEMPEGLAEALAMAQDAVSEIQSDAQSTAEPHSESAVELDGMDTTGTSEDGINAAMADAMGMPLDLPDLTDAPPAPLPEGLDLLSDVNLNVKIELGRTRMFVEDVLRLAEGAVVELDKLAGDPVDVFVNERLIAKGEVLVLNDNFCVRINEIINTELEAARASA